MPRKRTPTNLLALRGAFKKDPSRGRAREGEPVVSARFPGAPPEHLSAEQAATWRELVQLVPSGVLTAADVLVVELAAALLAEFRADSRGMTTTRIAQLRLLLGSLGLSPSDRAGLSIPAAPNRSDELDRLLRRKRP